MTTPISIIIADDQELFRDGLTMMLRQLREVKVIAEAEDGRELIELVHEEEPDIVLTSVKLPEVDGIAATKILRQKSPLLGIIGISAFCDASYITHMIEAGANGYVMKHARKKEFIESIKTVYSGKPYYCPETTSTLIALNHGKSARSQKQADLSERELKLIQYICIGKTNKEIARELFLSPRTVEALRLGLQEKLNAKNPVGLALYALQSGIMSA